MKSYNALKCVVSDYETTTNEVAPPKYQTILADPPWKYGKGFGYGAGEYYPLMKLEEIKQLDVNSLSDENAHLYLWCPNSLIKQGLEVMKAWGFEFKTVITWVKHRSIFGYYFKGQSEQLLFGVKGKLPPQDRCQVTIITGKVSNHSKKPDEQYLLIEKVSPSPRLELFARQKRDGWFSWGNEVKSDIKLEVKSGCDANDDGIPPNNKLLGILPTIL